MDRQTDTFILTYIQLHSAWSNRTQVLSSVNNFAHTSIASDDQGVTLNSSHPVSTMTFSLHSELVGIDFANRIAAPR
jgi:hypothetical protein